MVKKELNIAHFINSFYPCLAAGGVVNVAYQIAKHQTTQNNNVTIYTTDGCIKRLNTQTDTPQTIQNMNIIYFRNISNYLRMTLKIANPPKLPFYLKKHIQEHDILHLHEHRTTFAILASKQATKNNIPYIIQSHGSVLPLFQKEKWKTLFDKSWGNTILQNASCLLALTTEETQQYQKMGIPSEKIKQINNGINLEEYQNLPSPTIFREKYNISPDKIILLYLGRIHHIKGLHKLLQSLKELLDKKYPVHLVIVGSDDGAKNQLEQQAEKLKITPNITWTGPLTGTAKLEAYTTSNIFILPSEYETFSISTLEAMACHKPVIISTHCQMKTWINKKYGLVFREGKLTTTIEQLINNSELSIKYGDAGRKIVEEKYNWKTIVQELDQIYNEYI